MHWEKELDIRGPIAQAERCLDLWLMEENKCLARKDHARAAALMARYFQHEDAVTDQLMLSFLRHYSGRMHLDMEDPTSVRLEIKAALDKSVEKTSKKSADRGNDGCLSDGPLAAVRRLGTDTQAHHPHGRRDAEIVGEQHRAS